MSETKDTSKDSRFLQVRESPRRWNESAAIDRMTRESPVDASVGGHPKTAIHEAEEQTILEVSIVSVNFIILAVKPR